MTISTIERAYQVARSGEAPDFASLKKRLHAEGCRAVDALLSQRSLRGHLEAICAASSRNTPAPPAEDPGPRET
ncbi:hypothetical protein [Phenylobacterium sp.]|uniref:hypothetical protein n=1 Tax=Phenylobacterium sp. TaxID=1871053 RepID=UPI003918BFD4